MLLPLSLLALVQSFLTLVDAQNTRLSLDTVQSLNTTALPNPPVFTIPSSNGPLYVSVALCANSSNPPRLFVTNDTGITQPNLGDVDNVNTYELTIGPLGYGSVMAMFPNNGFISVMKGSTETNFELLVSATNATADVDYPFVGDTTSNQALVFSPPFDPVPIEQPSYPNYTLPSANQSLPAEPSNPANYSLVFGEGATSGLRSLPRTTCAIRAAARQDTKNAITLLPPNRSQGLWLRDSQGWRWQWFVGGLTPKMNYTAFMLREGRLAASPPLSFVTKSASFNCPLVHNLPFCPSVAYTVPLAAPRPPATAHTANTIPPAIADSITEIMANFTTTLTTLACGRDHYSPLVTCADCQQAYRTWLCSVSFPRCGEAPANSTLSARKDGDDDNDDDSDDDDNDPPPVPAIIDVKAGATPRNPALPPFASDHQVLLPCLETCNAADRACPAFLGFKCPLPRFTAAKSYGVGYIDRGDDGTVGKGSTAVAQDVYGNVWCNGS